jgi:atypical dual specificity phosphatase
MEQKPVGFSWVVAEKVAAMGRPTILQLEYLKDEGIDLIISLTETPLMQTFIEEYGFSYLHMPISDFHAPEPEQVDDFVQAVTDAVKAGQRVAVHCAAGKGRTGTMLACYLVAAGSAGRQSADDAIEEIRRLRPGSIETDEQEQAVRDYEMRLRGRQK